MYSDKDSHLACNTLLHYLVKFEVQKCTLFGVIHNEQTNSAVAVFLSITYQLLHI